MFKNGEDQISEQLINGREDAANYCALVYFITRTGFLGLCLSYNCKIVDDCFEDCNLMLVVQIWQLMKFSVCEEAEKSWQQNYCATKTGLEPLEKFNHHSVATVLHILAGFLTDYDFKELKVTWSSTHLCVGILIFNPAGEFLLQIKFVGSIIIYIIPVYLILLALSILLNLSKYPLVKRMLLLNVFVKSVLISASYSRGVHVQSSNKGNLGVLKSTILLIYYVACLAIVHHRSWIASENCTNVSNLIGGMSFDNCVLYVLDSLLVALDTFSLVEVGSTRFIFDPGGECSRVTSKAHYAMFERRLPDSYLCFTILVVRCPFLMCCQSNYKPTLGALLLILEDKDPLKEGVFDTGF